MAESKNADLGGPQAFYDSLTNLAAVQHLIDQEIRESATLEYKSGCRKFTDKEKNDIAKDVTALANSEGGVLIYGVESDPEDKTKPTQIDGLFMSNLETFDRVVNQQVRRVIQGLCKKVLTDGGVSVLVVHVPQSVQSPHQSLHDNKYYYRAGTESRPMDHHLVELHFGRRLGPILDLETRIIQEAQTQPAIPGFSDEIHVVLTLTNNGQRSGHHVDGFLQLPNEALVRVRQGRPSLASLAGVNPGVQEQLFGISSGKPIHPGYRLCASNMYLRFSKVLLDEYPGGITVAWTLFADDMNFKEGLYVFPQIIVHQLRATLQPLPEPPSTTLPS